MLFLLGTGTGLFTVFVGWKAQGAVSTKRDPYHFEAMAASVLRGEGFRGHGIVLRRRGPLYPLFIAGIYSVAGRRPIAVQAAQCLLLGGICVLAWDMGRRLFNSRAGLLAGVLCAFNVVLLRYVPDMHLEVLLAFLVTLSIWLSIRLRERPAPARGIAFGAACGLAALTKAVILLYPIVFAVWWLLRLRGRPLKASSPDSRHGATVHPLRAVAAALASMALVILPWTVRNYLVTGGRIVPITTGLSDAFLRGYVFSKTEYALLRRPPYTDAENESNAWFRRLGRESGFVWERDDLETDQYLNRAAIRQLVQDPGGLVRKSLVGLATFWYQLTSLTNSLIAGGLAAVAWALALVGWRRSRRERRATWPLWLPILYLNILLALLLALGRYSMPVLPALWTLAAFGLDTLLPRAAAQPGDDRALAETAAHAA